MRYVLAALLWLIPSLALANVITPEDVSNIHGLIGQLAQLVKDTAQVGQSLPNGSKEQFCAFQLAQDFGTVEENIGFTHALSWIASDMRDNSDEQRVLTVPKDQLIHGQKLVDLERLRLTAKVEDCASSAAVVEKVKAGLGLIESASKLYADFLSRF